MLPDKQRVVFPVAFCTVQEPWYQEDSNQKKRFFTFVHPSWYPNYFSDNLRDALAVSNRAQEPVDPSPVGTGDR